MRNPQKKVGGLSDHDATMVQVSEVEDFEPSRWTEAFSIAPTLFNTQIGQDF